MAWYFKLSWIGLICFLIGLPAQSFALAAQVRPQKNLSNSVSPSIPRLVRSLQQSEMSDHQLYELARSVTVKIMCGEGTGSGILVSKKGTTYQVLTNAHVLEQCYSTRISIKTPDNQVYSVSSTNQPRHGKYDLSLVSFNSKQHYPTASLGTANSYAIGSEVFAAGFPSDQDNPKSSGFVFKSGQIKKVSEKSFEDGYQIGYTSQVEKGMSGGPLLNRWGQVIGINGIQSYPPWASPYAFDDGSIPTKAVWEQMQQLSWAIPIGTLERLGFSSLGNLSPSSVTYPSVTGLESPVSPKVLPGSQTEDIDYSAAELDPPIYPSPRKERQTGLSNSIAPASPREDQTETEETDYSAKELDSFITLPNLKETQTAKSEYSTSDDDQPNW